MCNLVKYRTSASVSQKQEIRIKHLTGCAACALWDVARESVITEAIDGTNSFAPIWNTGFISLR